MYGFDLIMQNICSVGTKFAAQPETFQISMIPYLHKHFYRVDLARTLYYSKSHPDCGFAMINVTVFYCPGSS